MQFRNQTDEYLADGLDRYGARYEILRGPEFELRYSRLIEKYGNAFTLSPVTCREIDGVDVEPYRTCEHPFLILFYATQKDAIGHPFYVIDRIAASDVPAGYPAGYLV